MTRQHLAYLRSLKNELMFRNACKMLDKLNKYNAYYDINLLDRSLELHEGIDNLKHYHSEIITHESQQETTEEYWEKEYKEYLENEDVAIAEAEEAASAIAEYEAWAEEQQRLVSSCKA